MMTPYVVTRYYRAPEVILGMGYKENGRMVLEQRRSGFMLRKNSCQRLQCKIPTGRDPESVKSVKSVKGVSEKQAGGVQQL